MVYDPEKHHRRSVRLRNYDYKSPGAYFVTICSWRRECIFGDVIDGSIHLTEYGAIVGKFIGGIGDRFPNVQLDYSVIMPNHVHAIIIIKKHVGVIHELPLRNESLIENRKSRRVMLLPKIVSWLKMNLSKQINKIRNTPGLPVWQRNYFERVIRNEKELFAVRNYIAGNPLTWSDDKDNPVNLMR